MRIIIVGKFYTEGMGCHLEDALLKMDHEVVRVDPELDLLSNKLSSRRSAFWNQVINRRILESVGNGVSRESGNKKQICVLFCMTFSIEIRSTI